MQRHHSLSAVIIPCIVCVLALSGFTLTAMAQPSTEVRERRRNFVEGLLRTLVESQEEEETAHGHSRAHDDHNHGPPKVTIQPGPINPGRPAPRPGVRPQAVPVTREMVNARRQLKQMNLACAALVRELSVEQQYIPQVKPLLADCLSIQAATQVLWQRAEAYPDVMQIRDDCQRLDRKWRVLAHRLKRIRNLNASCKQHIEVIDNCGAQLCSVCDYQPQFDRNQVIVLTNAMAGDMEHLMQDVYQEVNTIPNGRQILKNCKALYAHVSQSQALARTGTYEQISNRYQDCQRIWRTLAPQLARCNSVGIAHHVQEIERLGQQFQETLWIPVEVDMQYIQHLMESIDANVHVAFSHISVDEFLGTNPLCPAITACAEFVDGVHRTAECFSNNPSLDELQWDFRSLDVQWNEVQSLCRQFKNPQLHRHLDEIQAAMTSARGYLGDVPAITQPQLVQFVDDMHQLSHDVHHHVEEIVASRGFDARLGRQVNDSCLDLESSIQDLHHSAITECTKSHLRARDEAQRVLASWNRLKPQMQQMLAGNCTPRQRQECLAVRNQIEPMMVKLQLIYAG